MMRKSYALSGFLFVGLISGLLVSGCRLTPRSEENAAQVRLINAVPDLGGVNVSVDGQRVWKKSLFRTSTGYQSVAAGTYPVRIEANSSGAGGEARPLGFEKGHRYTMLALGPSRGGRPAEVQVLEDEPRRQGEERKTTVRLVNGASGLAPVDLVVNNIVALKAVAYGRRSPALTLDGGRYDLKIVLADTPDAVLGPVTQRLEPGRSYTLVTMGRTSDQTLSLEAYLDAP